MQFTAAGLFASLIVGAVGLSLFVYGRKQVRVPHLVVGMAMLVYPYFVENFWITYAIAAALIGALWFAIRMDW